MYTNYKGVQSFMNDVTSTGFWNNVNRNVSVFVKQVDIPLHKSLYTFHKKFDQIIVYTFEKKNDNTALVPVIYHNPFK